MVASNKLGVVLPQWLELHNKKRDALTSRDVTRRCHCRRWFSSWIRTRRRRLRRCRFRVSASSVTRPSLNRSQTPAKSENNKKLPGM